MGTKAVKRGKGLKIFPLRTIRRKAKKCRAPGGGENKVNRGAERKGTRGGRENKERRGLRGKGREVGACGVS